MGMAPSTADQRLTPFFSHPASKDLKSTNAVLPVDVGITLLLLAVLE